MEPDYRAKLLALADIADIQLDDSVLVGEDMHHNVYGSRCKASCRLCGESLIDMTSRQRWAVYQRAGEAIVGHAFSCTAAHRPVQLSLTR
jgi:hypothetical protein